jgi:hypothetical protein
MGHTAAVFDGSGGNSWSVPQSGQAMVMAEPRLGQFSWCERTLSICPEDFERRRMTSLFNMR